MQIDELRLFTQVRLSILANVNGVWYSIDKYNFIIIRIKYYINIFYVFFIELTKCISDEHSNS